MMTGIARGSVLAAAMFLLLAGCTTDSGEQSRVSGVGTGTGSGVAESPARPRRLGISPDDIWDRVFFDVEKSELTPDARALAEGWARWLKSYPNTSVVVEGHCDERGTREYNLGLGERRAMAVKNYLVSLGIDARRITAVSYGKERPAVVGSAEVAYSQNRRAVAVVN